MPVINLFIFLLEYEFSFLKQIFQVIFCQNCVSCNMMTRTILHISGTGHSTERVRNEGAKILFEKCCLNEFFCKL